MNSDSYDVHFLGACYFIGSCVVINAVNDSFRFVVSRAFSVMMAAVFVFLLTADYVCYDRKKVSLSEKKYFFVVWALIIGVFLYRNRSGVP